MMLPAADLGIMAEHLSAHEGVITKLRMYDKSVNNLVLKNMLTLHIETLTTHVKIMLALINPDQGKIHLPDMAKYQFEIGEEKLSEMEKDIALELRSSAKLMGSDNFNSALMMKNNTVRNIHIKMAYQDITMQMLYDRLLHKLDGAFVPKASKEMQQLTLRQYEHVVSE